MARRNSSENYDKEAYIAAKKAEQEKINNLLIQGVESVLESDNYKAFLSTMSKFHNYSFNNSLLIYMQSYKQGFEATKVASKTNWKKLGREINEDTEGLMIYRPSPWKKTYNNPVRDEFGNPKLDENGRPITEEKTVRGTNFVVEYVYDISQTNGKELPDICNRLEGTLEGDINSLLLNAIKEVTIAEIIFDTWEGHGENGYYSPTTHQIHVRNDMSEVMQLKTAIHEAAHSILHCTENNAFNPKLRDNTTDITRKELEAESVAFIVMNHFGISEDYSFEYLASWSRGDTEKLKEVLPYIQRTADVIINGMENYLEIEREILTLKEERSLE